MRITSSMYYKSLYGQNNTNLSNKLFDVNKQIASGLKIQHASDDVSIFSETMRLDNEITTLKQIKQSTQSGFKVSNQTDVILNEFETTMNRMRTLFIQAANGTNDKVSRNAIAAELRGIEDHFRNLANSSINGQYLFSGSAVDTIPIDENGKYHGNDVSMSSFVGSKTQQEYNITGAELFMGEEVLIRRQVTSNVVIKNLTTKYPDFTDPTNVGNSYPVNKDATIREIMGDSDNVVDTVNKKHHFYLTGTRSNGETFNQKIDMRDDENIDRLLTQIGIAYGNTPDLDVINVTMNDSGQIVLEDKIKGSSKLEFHMIAATDLDSAGADDADVNDLTLLNAGEQDFAKIMNGTSLAANPNLHVVEFVKSNFVSADPAISNIDGLIYDKAYFSKTGSSLSSNIPQIEKETNAFATNSTKISEVADLSKGTPGTLDGTQFNLVGIDINGNAFDVQIDLKSAGSTFSLDGGATNYDIFDVGSPRAAVHADEMTYKQLTDVINMVMTANLPVTTNSETDYDNAIYNSSFSGYSYLSYDGKIQFQDVIHSDTKAEMAIFDSNSGDFSTDASVATFNSNSALTVRDPKTDFFRTIDEMITAVENHTLYPDSTAVNIETVGIENAITMMDDLQDHIFRSHSLVGAQSNALEMSIERTNILEISAKTFRSQVVDTDLAESSLLLTQLSLNYESMLSTVGKVSKLSLVNYL